MYRPLLLLSSLLLVTALAACEPAPPRLVSVPTPSPAPLAPITLGAAVNIVEEAGPDGRQRLQAARLAVEVVNRRGGLRLPSGERRTLELAVYDVASSERAEAAFRRLLDDGAVAVIGPADPSLSATVRLAAEAAGMPVITLDDAGSKDARAWHWSFSLAAPADEAMAATLDFFAASGVDRFAWHAPRTMEASVIRRTLIRLAAGHQMQLTGEETYAPGQEEHAQALARLRAGEPRVILSWPGDPREAAAIAREAGKVRDLVPIFLGPAASQPSTLNLAGDLTVSVRTVTLRLPVADDLWDHDALTPVIRDFRRELQNRTGLPPTPEAAVAWDAVRLIVAGIERAGPTRAAIRDCLEATTDFPGASGTITFTARRHDGLDRRAYVVARADARRWRLPP